MLTVAACARCCGRWRGCFNWARCRKQRLNFVLNQGYVSDRLDGVKAAKVLSSKVGAKRPASRKPFGKVATSKAVDAKRERPPRIELVFGFVGPTGVDLDLACSVLVEQLRAVDYTCKLVRSRELIGGDVDKLPEHKRIDTLMTEGNRLRKQSDDLAIIARRAIAKIRQLRQECTRGSDFPSDSTAYIVRSLKRQEEVTLLREVYGKSFTLISVYATQAEREKTLSTRFVSQGLKAVDAEREALHLIQRDYREESEKFGQRVADTFALADFFATADSRSTLERQLGRLVRLLFGVPYISPTRDEQGMFFAYSASLRSLDLSRQVGAAVTTPNGEILATGCNDVPAFGGGLYWGEDSHPMRDYERGYDSNALIKLEIVSDTIQRFESVGWSRPKSQKNSSHSQLAKDSLFTGFLKPSRLADVIEFGRAVHAEMDCLTQAARLGVALRGGRLYSTTFPCHLCARHIVAVGISQVIFVEPYEKSRTADLYRDSIVVEPRELSSNLVNFTSFVGVAPRRYASFFTPSGGRKKADGSVLDQQLSGAKPRVKRLSIATLYSEDHALSESKT